HRSLKKHSAYEQETQKLKYDFRIAKHEHNRLKKEADSLLEKNIDENSLQVVLRLFDLELQLVNNLIHEKTGIEVEKLLNKREKILKIATETVAFFYKTVMNFATSNTLFNAKRRRQSSGPLYGGERRNYLKRMQTVLSDYRQEFSDKKYLIVQQALHLPKKRYHAYVSQPQDFYPQSINTSIDIQKPLVSTLYPNQNGKEYHQRLPIAGFEFQDGFKNRSKKMDSNFIAMKNSFIEKMPCKDIIVMIDNVSQLIQNEIYNHIGSLKQRRKMFYGDNDSQEISTSIDIIESNLSASPKAKIMFGTIRDAAVANTMKVGWWNPDIYENNLRQYASRLEGLKNESKRVLEIFRQTLKETQESIDKIFMKKFQDVIKPKELA
ncbi:hypothetical protein KAH94_00095, partial [bacterium]|nr:hypothetical protein [bacterium]